MLAFVREHSLEGIVAKRADSVYQPGKRSGLWAKHRISLGQEFVVGGYVPSNLGLDSLVVGFYRGTDPHIRLPRSSGLHPCNQAGGVRENQTPADLTLSLRESSRDRRGAMGTGANG